MVQNEQPPVQRSDRHSSWQYQPDIPIETSPIFAWPPRPIAILKWFAHQWLTVTSITIVFCLAWLIFVVFLPGPETAKTFSGFWITEVYIRNLILLWVIAGGLHLWLYQLSNQETLLKYDRRKFVPKDRDFTFNNQVLDNIFWSCVFGVTIWTGFEAAYYWTAANDYAPGLTFSDNPAWFISWFVVIPIWNSLHFYIVHRALHWPIFYKLVHSLHHRNISTGPWSGLAKNPIEHVLYFSSLLIHFVVPSSEVHVLFHALYLGLTPAFSHSGFDGLVIGGRRCLPLGDFFHQLHHRYFECNYGTADIPWDRWFGTFHDGSEDKTRIMRHRRRNRHPEI